MSEQKSAEELANDLLADVPLNTESIIELPSGKTAKIKPITFEEEKMIVAASNKKEDPSKILLSNCVSDLDLDDILLIDKVYLIFKIRELSFGSVFKFVMGCPACSNENHYSIDIDKLPVKKMELGTNTETFTLPMTKKEVTVRYATVADENKVLEPSLALDNLWRFVTSFAGSDRRDVISRVIKKLPAGDVNTIITKVLCEGYGINSEVRVKCDSCGHDQATTLPLTKDFFSVT